MLIKKPPPTINCLILRQNPGCYHQTNAVGETSKVPAMTLQFIQCQLSTCVCFLNIIKQVYSNSVHGLLFHSGRTSPQWKWWYRDTAWASTTLANLGALTTQQLRMKTLLPIKVYHAVDDSELAKLSTPDLSGKKVSGYSMRTYGIRLGVFSGEYDAERCWPFQHLRILLKSGFWLVISAKEVDSHRSLS